MLCRVEDWTDESFQEDCYVDIRAYGKEGKHSCNVFSKKNHFFALHRETQANAHPSFWLDSLPFFAERTREVVLDGMKKVQKSFLEHDLVANVRLETYEGERYFHLPPSPAEK